MSSYPPENRQIDMGGFERELSPGDAVWRFVVDVEDGLPKRIGVECGWVDSVFEMGGRREFCCWFGTNLVRGMAVGGSIPFFSIFHNADSARETLRGYCMDVSRKWAFSAIL